MNDQLIYDIIGIGIGPFNLGLAALAQDLPELNCLFIDSKEAFSWHPGMLIPGTRMQVPFYADLVTLADPCSKFSYFSFLKANQRMIRFGVLENNFPLRSEYNEYCQWVAAQLPSLRFGQCCVNITYNEVHGCYEVHTQTNNNTCTLHYAKNLVIGIGTVPFLPPCTEELDHPLVFHAKAYLQKKPALLQQKNITLVGSGQSAAEIFSDLLQHADKFEQLSWFTRSERIEPMDYSKFSLELTSPRYIDHFYRLTDAQKRTILTAQHNLYKCINIDTIQTIYEQLHQLELTGMHNRITIRTNTSLQHTNVLPGHSLQLQFAHRFSSEELNHRTNALVLATGFSYQVPGFLHSLHDRIQWKNDWYDVQRNYSVDRHNTIFVQNADLYTHGFNSADLGMGPYRNAVILNAILGREELKVEQGTPFQSFAPFSR
jgi:lysine N6-hydroxylase